MFLRLALASLAVLGCAAGISAVRGESEQHPRITIEPRAQRAAKVGHSLRIDLNVVLVPVTVTDAMNRPITSLARQNFRVLEDGVEQEITSFTREEGPISLGLVFDSSGSMKNRIDASVEALKQFFLTTIPGDEFFVVQFADQARLLGGFTTSPDEIYARLGVVQANGWTALLDAVALSAHQMKYAKHRKVLLILSDGNDNNSRYSESEIRDMVMEGDLSVYAIALGYRPRVLQALAEETGGKVLVAQNTGELPDVVQRLSAEIRSQYVLGYSPSNAHKDGKYRKVKVELVQPAGTPGVYASWRRGYYAPPE